MQYSQVAKSALSAAGWSPDRHVAIGHWAGTLEAEGYTLSGPAARLLSNLGGLTVHLPADPPRNPYSHDLIFDPLYAGSGERDRAEDWEQQLGRRLFPVGHVTGACPVWIAEDGAVYYGIESGLYRLGEAFAEALERLLAADIGPSPVIA